MGEDLFVLKKDCHHCDILSAKQKPELATTTYKIRKEHIKKSKESPSIVDPETVKLQGRRQSVTGTSSVQTTGVVTKVSSSQHPLSISLGQIPRPVTQPTVMNQFSNVPGVMALVQTTGQATNQHVTGATDVQFTGLVTQPVNSKMSLPPVSLTSAAAHCQDPDSDVEHYSEPTSPTQPMEYEREVSDRESTKPE